MSSFVRLSLGTAIAIVLAACSSTTDPASDGGVAADTGVKTDTGTGTDTGTTADTGGGTDSGGDDAGACELPGSTGDTDCDKCLLDNCCDVFAACAADQECVKLNNCVVDCDNGKNPDGGTFDTDADGGTKSCVTECATAHPSGVNLLVAQQSCLSDKCDSEDAGSTACGL